MEPQEALGGLGADRFALVPKGRAQPRRFAWQLLVVDVGFAPAGIRHHEPGEAGTDDESDDEEPPVELGVHRRQCTGRAGSWTPADTLSACSTSLPIRSRSGSGRSPS